MRFTNKNILVTGGNSGIGLATARAFAAEGGRVAITGRNVDTLRAARATLGDDSVAIVSDAGSLSDIKDLTEQLRNDLGRLDAVFVNAGIAKFGAASDIDESTWDETFDANIKGPYFLIQKLAPLMTNGGSIVLNGSVNAHVGMPGSSVYAASKAALLSLRRTLSAELIPQGIRVNVVSRDPSPHRSTHDWASPKPNSAKWLPASRARLRSVGSQNPTRSPRVSSTWPATTVRSSSAANSSSTAE